MNNIQGKMLHFGQFVDSVALLNLFQFDRYILNYQNNILSSGRFSIISPYRGKTLEFSANFYSQTQKIYYLFEEGNHTLFLVPDDIGWGWPVRFLIFPKEEKVYALDKDANIKAVQRNDLLVAAKDFKQAYQPKIITGRIRILLGHPNFAHYLWNELSALEHLISDAVSLTDQFQYELINLFQPLGPVEELIDPDQLKAICTTFGIMPESHKKNVQFEGSLLRIGARLVTNKLKEDLKKQIRDVYDEKPVVPALSYDPVFWISIKDKVSNRVCTNQLEFLSRLIFNILKHYPQCKFIVDAFSLPVDYDANPMYKHYREQFNLLKESAGKERQKLLEICIRENPVLLEKMILTDQDSIYSSLHHAQFADFYICHAGSLQHKIGWIYHVPGIIHLPQAKPGHARYHMSQTEKSADVFLLPDEFTEEIPESNQIHRNRNYIISDIDGATDYCIKEIKNFF